jgi:hypothetical protein
MADWELLPKEEDAPRTDEPRVTLSQTGGVTRGVH